MSIEAYLMQMEPSEATRKLPRPAGGCTAPHVPSLTIAMEPSTMAWHSLITKSMLAIPIMVLTMLTDLPWKVPGYTTRLYTQVLVVEVVVLTHARSDADKACTVVKHTLKLMAMWTLNV